MKQVSQTMEAEVPPADATAPVPTLSEPARPSAENAGLPSETLERIRNSGVLDPEWYLKKYPDVAREKADPAAHYLEFGAYEGRDPGPFFSTSFYLKHYPQCAMSGTNPVIDYLDQGALAGRDPSPHFSSGYYLSVNPDVATIGVNPLEHFIKVGRTEGRLAKPC